MSQAFHGGNLLAASRRFKRDPNDFIDFSSNLNIWLEPVLPASKEILREVIRYPEVEATTLHRQLASIYGVAAAHVLPTAGAAEALYLAMRLFAGKRVGIIEPAYGDYSRACRAAKVAHETILLSPQEWFLPLSAYADRLKNFDVVVFGNPNNPTGHFHPRAGLLEMMRLFPEKAWIVDEAFIDFVDRADEETLLSHLGEFSSLIVIGSLTKSWRVPGLRVGFLATSNGTWLEMTALWQPPWSLNGVAQLWARENLTKSGSIRMMESLRPLTALRARFVAELAKVPEIRVHPGRANFLLLELLSVEADELEDALGREGMLVRTCDSFSGMAKNRFLRVAVRNEDENCRLATAMARFHEGALQSR